MKLLFLICFLSVMSWSSCIWVKMLYSSYQPKTFDGSDNLLTEDYHVGAIVFATGGEPADPPNPTDPAASTYIFKMFYDTTDVANTLTKNPGDQTDINYMREYFLPGNYNNNFIYSRTKPDNSEVKKYYVMYNIVGSCSGSNEQIITFRIKYFWCFNDARTFFLSDNTDKGSGAGSNLKLIHNTFNFEDSQQTIQFGSDAAIKLRQALISSTGTCNP